MNVNLTPYECDRIMSEEEVKSPMMPYIPINMM